MAMTQRDVVYNENSALSVCRGGTSSIVTQVLRQRDPHDSLYGDYASTCPFEKISESSRSICCELVRSVRRVVAGARSPGCSSTSRIS